MRTSVRLIDSFTVLTLTIMYKCTVLYPLHVVFELHGYHRTFKVNRRVEINATKIIESLQVQHVKYMLTTAHFFNQVMLSLVKIRHQIYGWWQVFLCIVNFYGSASLPLGSGRSKSS